jgi:pimeloyl-ACP methyl ester carboxylesterase
MFADERARAMGVRLLAPDRPGIGLTDKWHDGDYDVASYGPELGAIADALGIDRFGVLGYSGGAPYALAAAHALPDRVTALAVVAGAGQVGAWAERRDFESTDRRLTFLSTRVPPFAVLVLDGAARVSRVAPRVSLWFAQVSMSATDRETMAQFESPRAALALFTRAFERGAHGVVADYAALARPWGFPVEALQDRAVPIAAWHGDADDMVPVRHTEGLVARVSRAELTIWPGAGHLALIDRAGDVLDWLADRAGGAATSAPVGRTDQLAQ